MIAMMMIMMTMMIYELGDDNRYEADDVNDDVNDDCYDDDDGNDDDDDIRIRR